MRPFTQVDVFTDELGYGNPVAVVHDADGLTDDQLAAFARWTNLSETTFVLPPTDAGADYRLRIFTTARELPFAGHPTLGSARAWLEAGGTPRGHDIVQQCGAGLVRVRQDGSRLAFAAPPLIRGGAVDPTDLADIIATLRVDADEVVDAQWADNGPGWVALLLRSAEAVLAVEPDWAHIPNVGLIGPYRAGSAVDYEVRAMTAVVPSGEDPVTGSLNAAIAQWLIQAGVAPASYLVSQGTVMQRRGRVHVRQDGDGIWVGGDTVVGIRGTVAL